MGDSDSAAHWFTQRENRTKIGATLLALYTLRIAADWQGWHFPDNLNLPIHETGHLVFAWGGELLTAMGGTLFQLLLPLTFALEFLRRHDRTGTGCMIWWSGQSGVNVARYIADARVQELPLVGGGQHDWTFLLSWWGLLEKDVELARAVLALSVAVMVLGVWWMLGARRTR